MFIHTNSTQHQKSMERFLIGGYWFFDDRKIKGKNTISEMIEYTDGNIHREKYRIQFDKLINWNYLIKSILM